MHCFIGMTDTAALCRGVLLANLIQTRIGYG